MKHILDGKKRTLWMMFAAIAACAFLAGCDSAQGNETDPAPPPEQTVEASEAVSEAVSEPPEPVETVDVSKLAGMTPSTADMCGSIYIDGLTYLYVPLDENTYRYELIEETAPEDLTKGELLHTFTSDEIAKYSTSGTGWEIYAVAEDPDYSRILVYGGLITHLYQYSPAKAVSPDVLEQAKEDGCVIVENHYITYGRQTWLDFIAAAEEGKEASVQAILYYELAPETDDGQAYEVMKEDYPAMYTYDLAYDGSSYTVSRTWSGTSVKNGTGSGFTGNFQYLLRYDDYLDFYTMYVLANDNTAATWNELHLKMAASPISDPQYCMLFADCPDPQ